MKKRYSEEQIIRAIKEHYGLFSFALTASSLKPLLYFFHLPRHKNKECLSLLLLLIRD